MKCSVKTMARIGGLLYLIVIIGGIFAELFVRGKLVVPGDAAATAQNITNHEMLYRCGFAAEVFYCACNMPLVLIFYKLFKVVSKDLTILVVFFSIVGTAIESVSLLAHFAPLIFLGKSHQTASFSAEHLQAISYMSIRFFEYGFNIALVFFGSYCLCMGRIIFRSGFLPKAIGVLLFIQGICYLVNSFTNFLAPALAHVLFPILAISGLGEVSFCLWLLIKGVNESQWQLKAATAREMTRTY